MRRAIKMLAFSWVAGIALAALMVAARGQGAVAPDGFTASVDLGTVTIAYRLNEVPAGGATLQLFLHDATEGQWVTKNVSPNLAGPTGSFALTGLDLGAYDSARSILFVPGTYNVISDATYPLTFNVTTQQIRVTSPQMSFGTPYLGSDQRLHVPYTLKFPASVSTAQSVWVMAKGPVVFSQVSVPLAGAKAGTDPVDTGYLRLDGELVMANPGGVISYQGGAFDANWNAWAPWVWPGVVSDLGSAAWIPRCDPALRPTVAQGFARAGRAPWSIGGNLGNYSIFGAWGTYSNYGDPVYLTLLKRIVGVTWLRENFDPDRYLGDETYRHIVRSHCEALWLVGIVPVLAPQDEPAGATVVARDAGLVQLDAQLASDYADAAASVLMENCNEPHLHGGWAGDWAVLATTTLKAMRAADPDGQFLCATEGLSKSAVAVDAAPLPAGLCYAYDVHAYVAASQITAVVNPQRIKVVVGEYHDASAAFHQALEACRNVMGIGAWAWGLNGQDSLALCNGLSGYTLSLASDGGAIAGIYGAIRSGKPLPTGTAGQ